MQFFENYSYFLIQLTLEPTFEPIFGSVALFNIQARKKLTETFYFELNNENIMDYVQACQKYIKKDLEKNNLFNIDCRQALIPFDYKNLNGIFLLFKVNSIFKHKKIFRLKKYFKALKATK